MNPKPDIDSIKGIEEFKKNISDMITKLEELDPLDETSRQMLALLRLNKRLLEDKEEMLAEQHSRTSDEIKHEFKELTGMVENLLALDEMSRK